MTKRVGHLMPRIASLENLHESFLRAVRGKSGKLGVVRMRQDLDEHLLMMHRQLLDGTFQFGRYNFFEIVDQKRRSICAASFPERVAFQAMMRICHPVFENFQCDCSFASRPGRGTFKALERAQRLAGRYRWFAKVDVCKFFYSISHEVMMAQLCRLFKDPQLLFYFQRIIESYEYSAGRGLPIGNLTSQYWANHYLAVADHWAKEQLHVDAMVRYMDDSLKFCDDHDKLMRYVREYTEFVGDVLRLELHEPIVNRTSCGIPFLGYVVYQDCLRLSARTQGRFRRKMCELAEAYDRGLIGEQEYASRALCLTTFVSKADSHGFRSDLQQKYKGIYPERALTA